MFMQDATRFIASNAIRPALPAKRAIRSGLVAGTLVETSAGWRSVETLRRGDLVQSFDGGLREVVAVDHSWLLPGEAPALFRLPGGMFGNSNDLMLLPGQHLLIDTWNDSDLTDAVSALVPAATIARALRVANVTVSEPTEVATPLFAEEEVIWANSGLLLHCPGVENGVHAGLSEGFYPVLEQDVACTILRRKVALLAA